jgi:hypothetical protein
MLHSLDTVAFRGAFPAFADVTKFPDSMLTAYFANAGNYINQSDSICGGLTGSMLDFALQLMTAHLLYSFTLIQQGQTNVVISGSSVGAISVSLEPPPAKTGWEWWLATSPYGLQLWAMLGVQSIGGWSVGGRPESHAFRRVGGGF